MWGAESGMCAACQAAGEAAATAPAVALLGNPSDGWVVVGPYPTWDDAAEAHPGPDTWIMPLRPARVALVPTK
jgi:hypothetical protein